jgi:hypothetical protein
LDRHLNVECLNEPFNPELPPAPKPPFRTHDQLARGLDALYADATGFKHVVHWSGWPFIDQSFNEFLVTYRSPKIILMYRRNLLQRFISLNIAEQSHVWQPPSARIGRREVFASKFNAIDPVAVESYLHDEQGQLAALKKLCEGTGSPVYDLAYEDLYHPSLTSDDKLAKVNDILKFLGVDPFSGVELDEVATILSPKESKLNNDSTYELIPNAREIDRRFRSGVNGYIFETEHPRLSQLLASWLFARTMQINSRLAGPKRVIKKAIALFESRRSETATPLMHAARVESRAALPE